MIYSQLCVLAEVLALLLLAAAEITRLAYWFARPGLTQMQMLFETWVLVIPEMVGCFVYFLVQIYFKREA